MNARMRAVLGVALIMAGAFLVGLIAPPMQSPDEEAHLARAEILAQGHFLLPGVIETTIGGPIDTGLGQLFDLFRPFYGEAKSRMSSDLNQQVQNLRWSGSTRFGQATGTLYYFPLIYTPQAVALVTGKALGLSLIDTYYLVRYFTAATVGALLLTAFLITPMPLGVPALLLLPMSLFQIGTTTLDGISTAMVVLVLALFARAVRLRTATPPWLPVLMAVLLGVVITARLHAAPLLLLALSLPVFTRRRRDALWGGLALLGSAAWIAFAMQLAALSRSGRAPLSEIVFYYLSEPTRIFEVLKNTVQSPGILSNYADQFIGVLGWIDTPLVLWAYPALATVLIALLVLSIRVRRGTAPQDPSSLGTMTLLLVAALASVLVIFGALLITWSPHPARIIEGVQGRYFLIPSVILAYALSWHACIRTPAPVGPRRSAPSAQPGLWRIRIPLEWALLCLLALGSVAASQQALVARFFLVNAPDTFSETRSAGSDHPPGELLAGQRFEQPFRMQPGHIFQIDLQLATYERANDDELHFSLIDPSGQVQVRQAFSSRQILDNAWLTFHIPFISGQADSVWRIRLESVRGSPGNAITWWATGMAAQNLLPASVNGSEVAFPLTTRIRYQHRQDKTPR